MKRAERWGKVCLEGNGVVCEETGRGRGELVIVVRSYGLLPTNTGKDEDVAIED